MKPISIDFAPFSVQREWHRVHPVARWLAVAGLLLCLLAGVRVQKLFHRLDSLDSEAARLAARAARLDRRSAAVTSAPIDAKRGEAVNSAVARLNLPWSDILDTLEAATPQQVSLLSVTPDTSGAQLKIEAESVSAEAMIGYIKALELQPRISSVYLMKHERVHDGFVDVIRFQIEAQWRRAES
ncbi:PilN domain-containing protein [Trinickia dinghuensis]|uniref:Pilus assembly protein n=1 Tax=Trinickia dinghuensis TaxID=2291023 RepID=A0A3D8JZY8_9BURK|nr:PilN domain-containing protein [Trinickia dinghuensis]RDU98402.1 pilus assembly protein [Trinickia dinghuensis]